ncbi:MAG TPA: HEAT repeat domain-containing protein, partial [Candidatus Ozemobacteraceae bacterium]|nr:HEAT repeat domain-containing protein [Candidatus Ozemobacteraceae bacterium]
MQCPGCGFENENDNKFCNMCGMALPASGGSAATPLERAPLDLDLSLDLSDTSVPASAGGAAPAGSLDLGGFDLTPPASGGSADGLSLDLGASSGSMDGGALDLSLDAGSNAKGEFDLSFDSNATPSGLQLDAPSPNVPGLDLGSSLDSGGLNLDLSGDSGSSAGGLDLGAFDAPDAPQQASAFAAPEAGSLDMSLDLNLESGSLSADLATAPLAQETPVPSEPKMEFTPSQEQPAATLEEVSFDMGTVTTETASFDFGDLDSSAPSAAAPQNPVSVSAPTPAASDDSESAFLDQFILQTPGTPAQPPAPAQRVTRPEPAPAMDFGGTEVQAPAQEADFGITIEESPDAAPHAAEVDEDLASLFMGIEGKAPPKPAPVPVRQPVRPAAPQNVEAAVSEIDFDTATRESTLEIAVSEDETALQPGVAGHEEPIIDTDFSAEVPSASPVLEEMPPLTPQQQLEECRRKLSETRDPDARYSTVLEMKDLSLPEASADFVKLLGDELKDIREIAAEYLGDVICRDAVRPLIQCLSGGDASMKFIAARSLGNIKSDEAVTPLIKLLEEDNDDLRYVALEALGKIGANTALKAVSAFLKSRNHDLRYIACEAIGNLHEPQSVNIVLPILKDPDFEVRLKAIEALGRIGSTAACDQLLVMLGEDNERLRLATIQALGQIKNPNAVDAMIDIFQVSTPQIKEKIIWSLSEIASDRAVDPLLNLSQNFNAKQTQLAIEAFSKIKSPKACRFILSILDRADKTVRIKAIEALGEIGEKATAGNLVPFLDAPEPELKIAAAQALGKIGNPVAIDPLVNRLSDSERDVRLHAIEALGMIRGAKAIPALVKSLGEQDEQIVSKAEWALCELQEMAIEPLTKALSTESPAVVPSLVRVMGRIGNIRAIFPLIKVLETAGDTLKHTVADSLLTIDRHLTDDNPISVILKEGYAWAQFSIATALAQMDDERAFALLIKIAKETLNDKDFKKLAGIPDKRIVESSMQILHLIKLNVAQLFSKVGNDKAIPVIREFFAHGDASQRQWCVEALGGIQTEGALDALIDILKKPEFQIPLDLLSKQLIASKSRKLVEKLLLAASHPAEPVRYAIASVLGETRDPRAIRTLSQLVKDPADKVRGAAIEAIGKIGTTAAVPPAIDALKDAVEAVRAKAAQVLGELKDTAAVEFLEKTTNDTSELVRQLSVKSLAQMADARVPDIIIKALTDKSAIVRGTAVEMLGQRKDRVALPHLIKSLEDSAESVREKAAAALAMIGDTQAVMPLLARLDDPSPLVPLAPLEPLEPPAATSSEEPEHASATHATPPPRTRKRSLRMPPFLRARPMKSPF